MFLLGCRCLDTINSTEKNRLLPSTWDKVKLRGIQAQRAIALSCFFLSGFSGLVYEVAWIRKASLVFGATTFAVSTVLAVFFLGLACGSYLFGRIGQRIARPLRLYALIEIGLGLLALASPHAFDLVDALYGVLYRSTANHTAPLFLVRVLLVGLVVFPPTFLMGGTLPLFCRQYVVDQGHITRSIGALYGVNTLGAALGCVAAGLVLLPTLGLQQTVQLGAGLTILCGIAVGALPLARQTVPASPHPTTAVTDDRSPRVIPVLFFAVGFAALGGEVLWTRYLGLLVNNTVYTYTMTLTAVLIGIALGSLLAARFFNQSSQRARFFGALQVLSGLSVLILMVQPPDFWRAIGDLWVYGVLILPPAVLSGASFPLAVRLVVGEVAKATAGTGRMAALNTLGGVLGSLLVGFACLPFWGLEKSLLLVTGVSLATGCVAWIALDRAGSLLFRSTAVGLAVLVWLAIPRLWGTRIPADFLGDRDSLVAFREGFGSNLAISQSNDVLRLEIDRWWQGDSRKTHQVLAAHIPMLLHPDPQRVLVVGVGTGQTASRFLMYDIDHLAGVDIEPTIFDFIRPHFDARWMADERVALISADGGNYLRHADAQYDVISLEVGQLHRPGVAFFYTADFYHRARQRLRAGGLLSQFVPLSFLTPAQLHSTLQSFLDAFPQSVLWYNTAELLLIGVRDNSFEFDANSLDRLSSNPQVYRDLAVSYWGGPDHFLHHPRVFLAGFLMGPNGLAKLAAGAPLYRDDRPVLDYAAGQAFVGGRETQHLDALRAHLEPVERLGQFDFSADADIDKIRTRNLAAIAVGDLIKQVYDSDLSEEGVVQRLEKALRLHPDHFEANLRLAQILTRQRRYEEARDYYAEAVRINALDFLAQQGLGLVLHRLGRSAEAIPHYRQALRLRPDHAETHHNLGVALGQQGDFSLAQHHLQEALRLRPGYADAQRNLARIIQAARQAAPQP